VLDNTFIYLIIIENTTGISNLKKGINIYTCTFSYKPVL